MSYGMYRYGNENNNQLGSDLLSKGLSLDLSSKSNSTATGGSVNIDMSKKMDENKSNTIIVVASLVAVVGIMGFIFYSMSKVKN